MFGCGAFLLLFSLGCLSTIIRQNESAFNFPGIHQNYEAVVIDIPQDKPNSIAYKVELKNTNKKIVCYFPKDYNSDTALSPGDRFIFFSEIEPFKSLNNPDGFDYSRYMYNKGYAGYTFIRDGNWESLDRTSSGFLIQGIKLRQEILDFYHSLDLTPDEYALLSAITLGYKDALSDDVKESFRATGTAHILAVSGMHIGIIYLVILSLFGFIPRYSRWYRLKPLLSILMLWLYVFIIGFPPSAVRASWMLTAFCIALLINKKTYSLNILFATAFLMLIWNPFNLFDLGFQLSFSAVLSMLILLPVVNKRIKVKNKFTRYFYNLLLVSLSAQIGTFPLTLYYFGTFPTYFFITNLLIIPLIALIIYLMPFIIIASLAGTFIPSLYPYLIYLPVECYKIIVTVILHIIRFFESLPFAQLQNLTISSGSILLIWIALAGIIWFVIRKKPKPLIVALSSILLIIGINLYTRIGQKDSLIVYNKPQNTYIRYFAGYKKQEIENPPKNELLHLNGVSYLILRDDKWKTKTSANKFNVDYLHLCANNGVSLYSLHEKFNIKKIVLDSSLSNRNLKRFVSECEKLRIPYYDVKENGALRIFFY